MEGIFGFIHESQRKYPDKTYISSGDYSWTYSQVFTMVKKLSKHLAEKGIQKGDRIMVFCDNSIQYVAAFFSILALNAVVVPLNTLKLDDSFLYIEKKCTPRLIISCNSVINKLLKIKEKLCTKIFNIDELNLFDYAEDDCNTKAPGDYNLDPDNTAMIIFTSGTTAYPKGVMLTHNNLAANTGAIVEYLELTCDDSVLMTLPFAYSYGNSILLTHTFAGASIVIENSYVYPVKVLEGIKKYKVSGFSTVGSYINLVLKYLLNTQSAVNYFKWLRYITFAGESTNNKDITYINTNYPYIKVYVMYGQTEASARLSYLSPGLIKKRTGSIGKGLSNVVLRVVNKNGENIEPGEIGEIIAKGPSIMKGYWEEPEATKEVLKDGWLYTGDYATVDRDGYIYIKGRKTDIIKYMGHRISPVEIENAINSCEYIKESAVIESSFKEASIIKAFIVLEKKCILEEIKRYVYKKLPLYMRPKFFEVIEQLPRTNTGKIKRNVLRSN